MEISTWILFWKTVLTIGFGSFAILVLVIIPFGARDVLRLFKKLDAGSENDFQDTQHTSPKL